MQDRKKRTGVLVMLVIGLGLLAYGSLQLRTSRRLAAEGRLATAQVLDKAIDSGSKQRKAYYLEVQYRTEAGQALTGRSRVSAERFTRTQRGDTLAVRYLPTKPEVFALGTKVAPDCFHLLMGLLVLAIGGIYHFFGSSSRSGTPSVPA